MRIGIFAGDVAGQAAVDELVAWTAEVHDQGFPSIWLPQIFGLDAITIAGVIGREVPDIEIGTAVVPTYPRHPMMLAQQALTTNLLTGGRFSLGIGLSHQFVIETIMGMSFEKPLRHMREYLSILGPLVREGTVSFSGETMSCNATVDITGAQPCPILVAALGPQMLQLTGAVADGTITWMTGPQTLADHTTPTITAAASANGRPSPRILAGIPICVTDDAAGARERAATQFSIYGFLPSYRAMLDREGLEGPADIAIVGDEATVRFGIERFADSGVTDLLAVEFSTDPAERTRTRDLLRSLL